MSERCPSPSAPAYEELRRRPIQVNVPAVVKPRGPVWDFPGAGSTTEIHASSEEITVIREQLSGKKTLLSEWPATALCGNDLLSSCLFSSGIVCSKAGKFAPVPVLLVSVVLYLFRFVYEEAVTAIPLNGGSYNVLLNTTSKRTASFGAALAIISYLATCVVAASSGVNYLASVISLPLVVTNIALIFAFAALSLFGITDSSRVAMVIFCHHIVVLSVLIVASFVYAVQHSHIFIDNMHTELPQIAFAGDFIDSNFATAVFFGFGGSMLGVTGFETSAQFVEDQKPGVFRKTLRNMWVFASVFNTALIFLVLATLPMKEIYAAKDYLLGEMGEVVLGHWFKVWIAVDAIAVLSGAVLTSFVGIIGLGRRLACDRVLPAFLLKQNKWRGTNHYIILIFFVVASSLIVILNANTATLGGVYTYAFLSLMGLFAFGCMLLKTKRAEIPRDVHAPWWACILALLFMVAGVFANLLGDPKILMVFALYLIAVASIMMVMLERVTILKLTLAIMKTILPSRSQEQKSEQRVKNSFSDYAALETPSDDTDTDSVMSTGARGGRTITKAIIGINELPIVFFCKHPDLRLLNKAILYVRKNEQTHNLRVVHVSTNNDDGESGETASERKEFENMVALFAHIYPKLRIDFVHVEGEFEPAVVKWVAQTLQVPINLMFIAQPSDTAVHSVSKIGVRVITG